MLAFKHSLIALSVISASAALLTGCGDDKTPATPSAASTNGSAPAAAPKPSASNERDQSNARSAYSKSYNSMLGNSVSGLGKEYGRYKALKVSSKSPTPGYFDSDHTDVERYISGIKEIRSAGGSSGDAPLDSAADAVLAAGEKLIAIQKPLNIYFKSKGYLEDQWAKAKENDAAMTAAYDEMQAAFNQLGTELDRVQKQQRQKDIAKYKEKGEVLKASMLTSMDLAQVLVDGVDPERMKDPQLIAKLDETTKQLEASLQEMGQAFDAEKAKTGQTPRGGYESISRNLSSMIGAWREFKRKPNKYAYERIIRDYNSAVETMNRGM